MGVSVVVLFFPLLPSSPSTTALSPFSSPLPPLPPPSYLLLSASDGKHFCDPEIIEVQGHLLVMGGSQTDRHACVCCAVLLCVPFHASKGLTPVHL